MDIRIDEDFKSLLPDLSAEEYTSLEKDIVKHGVLNPIIVWNGIIIDGHNRYAICKAHRILSIPTKEISFKSKADAMQWIVNNQFARRNLSLSEKIILQAKVHAELEREAAARMFAGTNQYTDSPAVNLPQGTGRVSEQMAEKLGISEKTYRDAKYVVENGTQEQIDRMDKKLKVDGKPNGVSAIAREIREKDVPDGMKKCSACGKILPETEFYKQRKQCKECFNKNRGRDKDVDFKGNRIKTSPEYKDVPNQSIIDGLYTDNIGEMTIEDVIHEFMTNFKQYMSNLAIVLKTNKDMVERNPIKIQSMWDEAEVLFQKMRRGGY